MIAAMSLSGGDTRIVGGDDGVGRGQEPPGLRGMAKNGDDGLRVQAAARAEGGAGWEAWVYSARV